MLQTQYTLQHLIFVTLNEKTAQQCVHPTGGTLRVSRQFAWLEASPAKMASSRPAQNPLTPAVGRLA